MGKDQLVLEAIGSQKFLPLFYHNDADTCIEVVRALYAAGVRAIEFTNRGPAAFENFVKLRSAVSNDMPELLLGIGTIKNAQEAKSFIEAKADFIVCPVVEEEIGKVTHAAGLVWVPGCMTPTEINTAHQLDAKLIKVFPGNLVGPSYFTALKDIFPGQRLMPSGGVDLTEENLSGWFSVGAFAVALGSKLISSALMDKKDFEQIGRNAKKVKELIVSVKK
jgi:2-dehydro-3-deoxyphosphogluconate aldolase/(4S)-4-hydroxy-2-oxoglutarate aldolase